MYANVLVPTDGSEGTSQAVKHGSTIAGQFGATLHALSVRTEGPYDSPDEARRAAERAVEQVETEAERAGVEVVTEIRSGTPHAEILGYAEEEDVDLIVMGTHGRTGLDRVLVGSVTEQVVRNADVPVVTVRASGDRVVADGTEATELALEALENEGYENPSVLEEPHRTSGSWIVPADTDDGTVHVHVDSANGDVRLANIDRDR